MHAPLICRSTRVARPRISFLTFRIISFGSGPTTASLTASVTVLLLPPNSLPNIIACVKTGRCCCLRNDSFQRAVFNASRHRRAAHRAAAVKARVGFIRERRRHVRAYRVLVVEAGEVEFDGHGGGANTEGVRPVGWRPRVGSSSGGASDWLAPTKKLVTEPLQEGLSTLPVTAL